MRTAYLLLLLLLPLSNAVPDLSQVHLALGEKESTMRVEWATPKYDGVSEVHWGTSAGALDSEARGDRKIFLAQISDRIWYTRTAEMTDLAVGETYYYKVGDKDNGYSKVFSFTNRRTNAPYNHIIYGDLGAAAAFSLCEACHEGNNVCNATTCANNTKTGLVSEVGTADIITHVGDFAYNFAHNEGTTGDQFMNNIEQVAAHIPYMVSHGNHEDYEADMAQYLERFRHMPVNSEPKTMETYNGLVPNSLYFSWDYGLVHYVSFSTELFGYVQWSPIVTNHTMLKWLEKDLAEANKPENRAKFPWIVAHGHRPLYSSAGSGADALVKQHIEPLFYKYGVSFSINGHQHSYERSYPTYNGKNEKSYENPNATVYIVSGAAGCQEMHTPFEGTQPAWSAKRSNVFGYTRMIAHNASHMHFQQVGTDPQGFQSTPYGDVIDDFWVVQEHQGPFNPDHAPTLSEPCTSSPSCKQSTHDHFDALLRPMLGGDDTTPLHTLIEQYRASAGEQAWAKQLTALLRKVTEGRRAVWEDGLLDEKELSALKWMGGAQ